jgi:uncharacterized protein (TIGR03083 family)
VPNVPGLDASIVRTAFVEAANDFVHVVDQVRPDHLDRPALGSWNVLELIAHTARSFTNIGHFLHGYTDNTTRLDSPVAYFRAAFNSPDVHTDIADHARDSAAELGTDIATRIAAMAADAKHLVATTADDAELTHWTGIIALVDYLPTRVVELVIHTSDLRAALEFAGEPPATAAAVTLAVLSQLAEDQPGQLIRALTGRATLPDGFNLLR